MNAVATAVANTNESTTGRKFADPNSPNPASEKVVRNSFRQGETFIEGTVADLLGPSKTKLTINGVTASQTHLSALAQLGLVKEHGTALRAPGVKGPKPVIYRIATDNPAMKVARR